VRGSRIKTLVLYAQYTTRLSYFDDWLEAFKAAAEFEVTALDVCKRSTRRTLRKSLHAYEAIILLHSTNGDTLAYIEPYKELLEHRRGLLLAFVGNEVNLPGSPIADKRAFFKAIEPDYIATQLLPEAGDYLFGDCVSRQVVSIPHALNPQVFKPRVKDSERRVDVGMRSARYVAYLGDNDRNRLIDLFVANPFEPPLCVDINTSDRLARENWAEFLNSSKGTIATEAGSWYLERDDHTVNAIRSWAMKRARESGIVVPVDSPLRRFGHRLPWFLKAALRKVLRKGIVRHEMNVSEQLDFQEVYERFFRGQPRAPVYGKCISSRHFDAIGTKTCQIMVRGRFNDILVADEHYIPVSPDLSDTKEAVRKFREVNFRLSVVDRAYEHVLSAHTYQHRTKQVAAILRTADVT
jgi:spore maturation protein CgeB